MATRPAYQLSIPPSSLPPDALADWDTFWQAYRDSCSIAQCEQIRKQETFLVAYKKVGTVKRAAEAAHIWRNMVDWWRNHDVHHFRHRWEMAVQDRQDYIEEHVLDRIETPQGNRGSDILLMFEAKAVNPERYRELPVILGSDQSRDLLTKLTAMASADIARRTTVEAPAQTVEAHVRELLPGKARDEGKA